jgi:outer membrane protein OmpA-like peptidoglycan-associated protein
MIRSLAVITTLLGLASSAVAEAPPTKDSQGDAHEFQDNKSGKAGLAHGVHASKIKPTRTESALKFTLVDKDKGPIAGIVISLTAPDGGKYYTDESDAEGYAEVLVPAGKTYELVYLSLGRREISAKVPVEDEPDQTIKLTLRYKRTNDPEATTRTIHTEPRFVLAGVEFDTAKATIRTDSFARLDTVVEYLTHKPSSRIEISGHTDNVGNPKANKTLSRKRAEACRDYLVSKGVDAKRIEAVGYGDEKPIAANSTEEGRQKNRRIEATEL